MVEGPSGEINKAGPIRQAMLANEREGLPTTGSPSIGSNTMKMAATYVRLVCGEMVVQKPPASPKTFLETLISFGINSLRHSLKRWSKDNMIVELTSILFEQAVSLDVVQLFRAIRKGKHLALLRKDAMDGLDVWLKSMDAHLREEIMNIVSTGKRAVGFSSFRCKITVIHSAESDWEQARIKLDDAVPLLLTPLALLVENRHSDGGGLLKFVGKTHRKELEQLLDAGRIRFENGGGITVMLRTLAMLRQGMRADELAVPVADGVPRESIEYLLKYPGFSASLRPRHWRERLRLWVLFDRDGEPPGVRHFHEPSFDSDKIRALCATMKKPWPLPHHQHVRRAIENYLPERALKNWAREDRNKHRLLDDLPPKPERHHVNMKEALKDQSLINELLKCDDKALEKEIMSDRKLREFRTALI